MKNLRDFQFPDKKSRIAKIFSVFYRAPEDKSPRFKFVTSNLNLIRMEKGKSASSEDVIYQNYNIVERNDFSYTCKKEQSVINLFAVRSIKKDQKKIDLNEEEHSSSLGTDLRCQANESCMMFLMMNEKKKEEETSNQKDMVSVHCIDIGRRKLKPLFLVPKEVLEGGVGESAGASARLMAMRETIKQNGEFEFVLVVDKQKILYSKNVSEEDWFKSLKDTHLTITHDKLVPNHRKIALAFDLNQRGPSRFVLMSKINEDYLFSFFRVWDKKLEGDPPSIKHEFYFTHPCKETIDGLSEKIIHPVYQMVSFESNLSMVVTGGLFQSEANYYIKLLFFNTEQIEGEADDSSTRKIKMRFEDNINKDLNILRIIEKISPPKDQMRLLSEFQYVEATFEKEKTPYYLIVYGITFTESLFYAIARRSSNRQRISMKSYKLELKSNSSSGHSVSDGHSDNTGDTKKDQSFLSCIGSSMHLDVSQPAKIVATVPIAYGDNSSLELVINITPDKIPS